MKRYLGPETKKDKKGREYPNYGKEINLLAYCLMPNHFHLLIYSLNDPTQIAHFMQSLITTYVMYFNKKYKRTGGLFGHKYRAVLITSDDQLWHISRYIHLNPLDLSHGYEKYEYTSFRNYMGVKNSSWLKTQAILDLFDGNKKDYHQFHNDYIDRWRELKEIEADLY